MQNQMDNCRPCCCVVVDDLGAKTVLSGAWSAAGAGGMQIASSDAALLFDAPASVPWMARVSVEITYLAGAQFAFFLLAGADPDDVTTAQKLIHGVTATTVYDQLGSTRNPTDTPACDSGPPTTAPGVRTSHLVLCWDGETLVGTVSGSSNANLAIYEITMVGDRAGFGTGTLSNVTNVRFYDFELVYGEESGEPCTQCPEHCCKGPVPEVASLEISGVPAPPTHVWGATSFCTIDWRVLNGTTPLLRTCLGDASCNWTASLVTTQKCDGGVFTIVECAFDIVIAAIVFRHPFTGIRHVGLAISGMQGCGIGTTPPFLRNYPEGAFQLLAITELPCVALTGGVTLYNSGGVLIRVLF